jgi:general stress protein 26
MSADTTESRKHIADFLALHRIGVLATSTSEGKPHAATIYFTYDELLNIYFVTKKDTQKSRNLQDNPQAAIAVYDAASQTTVQMDGSVIEVTDPQQTTWMFNDIWRIADQTSGAGGVPPTSRLNAGGYVAYKLSAPSLRMASFIHADPSSSDNVFEVVHTQPSR